MAKFFSDCRETERGTEPCKKIYLLIRERTGIWRGTVALSVGVWDTWQNMHHRKFIMKNMQKWQFEDLPIIPEVWKVQVSEDKKKQFDVLCGLINRADVAYLVNGCDAGREGELIF